MRAVIYARYSSEMQRQASIEDQVRICQRLIEREHWQLVNVYADRGVSGASHLRPGYQNLLEVARQGRVDIVVAESIDRLSRDQEHIAALFKQLSFRRIPLVTVAEGEISELHVGLKGTKSALFLKDLAQKTHRGLEGRVRQGRSAGGRSYGYDIPRTLGSDGQPTTGERTINVSESKIIKRIFSDFAFGDSPRSIASALNKEGISGPRNNPWGASTIYGNWRRGTGVLNNELYYWTACLELAALRQRSRDRTPASATKSERGIDRGRSTGSEDYRRRISERMEPSQARRRSASRSRRRRTVQSQPANLQHH